MRPSHPGSPWSDSAAAVRARLGRTAIVGRAGELAAVRAELDAAFRGQPRVVLLAGEAGIGKSRLVAEAIGLTTRAGGLALLGRCVDEHGMPPYLPWIDAVNRRRPRLTPPTAVDTAAGQRTDADTGLPEGELRDLWRILTGDAPADTNDATTGSPEQRKLRLFNAVVQALDRLMRAQPLLLAFDDLQWSDAASIELLRYAVVRAPPGPLLVLGAYRTEEAAVNAELTRTLAELHRRRLATTVPVGPLAASEIEELVADLLQRPDPDLAAVLHRHGEGNPFVTEELVRTLADDGRLDPRAGDHPASPLTPASLPLPDSVVAIVTRRLDRVSDAARGVLEIAALAGREIAVDWIAAAVETEPTAVAALLDEAVRAALVQPTEGHETSFDAASVPADYAFLHDRVREAIAAQINPVRRRELHGRLGRALEALGGPTGGLARLAALSHHFRLAHDPERAAAYAERLGDAAMRANAHAEAVRAFRTAVDLASEATSWGGAEAVPGDLLLRLGDAALAAGDAHAIDAYVKAEAAFGREADQRGVARALHRLGSAHARREEFDLAVAYLEAALASLRGVDQGGATQDPTGDLATETAEVLVALGGIQGTSLARYEAAIAAGRRALVLTQESGGSRAIEAHARLALAKTLMRSGDLDGGHALLPPALALALRADHPALAAEVVGALANYHYWVGDLDASARAARQRRELAHRAGDPFVLRHAGAWLANLALARGAWAEAERLLAEAEPQVDRIESPEPHAFLRQLAGLLRFREGRYPEAIALLEEAAAGFRGSGPATLVWYLGCLAHAHLAGGDRIAADRVADETSALVAALPPGSLPRCPALAQLGIIAVRRDDVAAAERVYDALRPYAGQHHWVLVDRVRGMLAALLRDLPAAEAHFAAAVATASRGGIRPEFALARAEHGIALRRGGAAESRPAAERLLLEARRLLHGLGMAGDAARIEPLLPSSADDPVEPAPYPAGLTEREVEVLRLVAQGLTNRDIARRLAISEKTVANHLTHLYTKANLENRAAAVAFALRHDLV